MNYIIRSGQTVSDVVMATYNDLSYIYTFLQDNLQITNINFDLSSLQNKTVVYTPVNKPAPIILSVKPPSPSQNILTYLSRDGQNIHDICLQVYQNLSMIYKLITDNNWEDINTYPPVGTKFNYVATIGTDDIFLSYISKKKVHINTGNYNVVLANGRQRITSQGELRTTSNSNLRIVD